MWGHLSPDRTRPRGRGGDLGRVLSRESDGLVLGLGLTISCQAVGLWFLTLCEILFLMDFSPRPRSWDSIRALGFSVGWEQDREAGPEKGGHKATEGGLPECHSFAGSVGWNRVREQQSQEGADVTLPLYRWETEALRWEQMAHSHGEE